MCFLTPQHSRCRGRLAHGEHIDPVQSPSPCRHPGHASYFHPFNSCRKTLTPASVKGGSCSQLYGGLQNLSAGLSQL